MKRIADNLRVSVAGGSSLPVEIIHDFKNRFGVEIKEGYGLSETAPVATFNPTDQESRPGSIGNAHLGRGGAPDRRRVEHDRRPGRGW